MPFPDFEANTPALIRSLTERFGQRELIVLRDQRLSYRAADQRSAALAKGLLAKGLGKGSRVAILMPNGPDFLVAWWAAARIGALIVPINTFYKPKELGFVLRHADIEMLLMVPSLLTNDYLDRLEQCAPGLCQSAAIDPEGNSQPHFIPELPFLRYIYVWQEADVGSRPWALPVQTLLDAGHKLGVIDDCYLRAIESTVTAADPVMIIYSSGSTADPKGAVHSQGTLIRHAFNLNTTRDIVAEDRVFSPMPFFWVGGLVFTLFCIMHKGACIICEEVFDPGETLALIEREKVTIVSGWPHYGKAMEDHPSFKTRDLSSVRSGNVYPLLPEEKRPLDLELRSNSLGMTETCGPHCIDNMDADLPESLRGSFGRVLEGIEHKIIDPDSGATLAPGESGELCVRGYSLMQSLYKVERENVFDIDGFYRTGDGGYHNEEGYLFFTARMGDMIKTAGANVTPRDVEIVIDALPEVFGSYVVGLPDPKRGQNVAAAVVLNEGAALDPQTLQARLKEEMSAYKIPRHISFHSKADIPFTDSGKVDKKKLIALLQSLQVEPV